MCGSEVPKKCWRGLDRRDGRTLKGVGSNFNILSGTFPVEARHESSAGVFHTHRLRDHNERRGHTGRQQGRDGAAVRPPGRHRHAGVR